MAIKKYLSETGLATLWSQITSKFLSEVPVATSTTIGGVKSGEGLNLAADGTLSIVEKAKPSETFVITAAEWEGTGPYTVTKTLSNSYDAAKNNILSFPFYTATTTNQAAYNATARARIAITSCSGNTLSLVAFGTKPTVDITLLIAEV